MFNGLSCCIMCLLYFRYAFLSQIYLLPVLLVFSSSIFVVFPPLFVLLNSFIITIIIIVIFKVLFNIIANITAITTISLSRNEMKFNLITRFVEIFPFFFFFCYLINLHIKVLLLFLLSMLL